ncbi:hypothetical protein PGT21_016674 [Puccinia graminis f. sp. tritici]|uniref:Uncharacterized protein n=1 Tax=Puccinia graminis f. sp. tritici TaxID=56615 RepID=A0A5B0NYE3_PUCGR|nr:hypothetical protein PGTUg99_010688 [Puccinia graminis f. sp. tritici]KAA1094287.1 hypothetical protein PGT21_016674 [Puccinia graminis f. sp. tritici]
MVTKGEFVRRVQLLSLLEEDEALEEEERIEASEARKNSPEPRKRILPPWNARVKAPLPANIKLPPTKSNQVLPPTTQKSKTLPNKAGPAPKKNI